MTDETALRQAPPVALAPARDLAHRAVQLLTKAARANLPAAPDDSHSNIGWDPGLDGFISHPLPAAEGPVTVGFALAAFTLSVTQGGQTQSLSLAGQTDRQAIAWLDAQLTGASLNPAAPVALPYDLPAGAARAETYTIAGMDSALGALAGWYGLAERVLIAFADRHAALEPGPSAVRCWPHHFDLATYVSLEDGDFETARGIGVGLSPGDETYAQPYLYVNPWPHLAAAGLPAAPAPGHWHTDGFVGAIATADAILKTDHPADTSADTPADMAAQFIEQAFAIGRERLGV